MLKQIPCRGGTSFRLFTVALAMLLMACIPSMTWAHTDPLNSDSAGITISLTVLRNNGTTPVLTSGGTVTQCESVNYRATLSYAGGTNAAFEGGFWTITTPDGVTHDVTPAPALGCIGGTADDVAMPGGRGDCDPSVPFVTSILVPYTVDMGDVIGEQISASTALTGAFAHLGANDLAGVSASSPIAITVTTCDNGLFCDGTEICNPNNNTAGVILGQCEPGNPVVCEDDGNLCTPHFECDEEADECPDPGPAEVCQDDGDLCTEHFECDPNTGLCPDPGPVKTCEDPGFCANAACDPASGECVETDDNEGLVCTDPDTGDLCTPDLCVGGECVADSGTTATCDDPGFCANAACDPASGECVDTPDNQGEICDGNDAGSLCADDVCDDGECVADAGDVETCSGDECLECDPTTGSCDPIPQGEAPEECYGDAICRTPGFWGTHAGLEKKNSLNNITLEVLGNGLEVCGVIIDNTDVGNSTSAVEAICTKGGGRDHLVRDLTSAQLNCALNGCPTEIADRIAECNDLCAVDADAGTCQPELDCYNNGGTWDGASCITGFGYCFAGEEACSDQVPCVGLGDYCVPIETCHDRDLCPEGGEFCFEPPGPAGSSGACNQARKNGITVP